MVFNAIIVVKLIYRKSQINYSTKRENVNKKIIFQLQSAAQSYLTSNIVVTRNYMKTSRKLLFFKVFISEQIVLNSVKKL